MDSSHLLKTYCVPHTVFNPSPALFKEGIVTPIL